MMGGFALETNLSDEQFLPDAVTRLALTVEGLKFLGTHAPEMIPDLPPVCEIKDKSKANNFSKAFACLQLLWFGVQCAERLYRKLPVSLIEITTVAHCVNALIINALWWNKPFSIEEPTTKVICGEKTSAICAYMWMSSLLSGYAVDESAIPEFESIEFCPGMVDRSAGPEAIHLCRHSNGPPDTGSQRSRSKATQPHPGTSATLLPHSSAVDQHKNSPDLVLDPPDSTDRAKVCQCCGISSTEFHEASDN